MSGNTCTALSIGPEGKQRSMFQKIRKGRDLDEHASARSVPSLSFLWKKTKPNKAKQNSFTLQKPRLYSYLQREVVSRQHLLSASLGLCLQYIDTGHEMSSEGVKNPFTFCSSSGLVQVEHSQTFYWLLATLAWWTSSSCLWTTVHIRKKSPLDTGTGIQPYPQTPAALQTLPQQPGWDTRITAMSVCPGSLINRIM